MTQIKRRDLQEPGQLRRFMHQNNLCWLSTALTVFSPSDVTMLKLPDFQSMPPIMQSSYGAVESI
jgi:hypothetical protein